MAVAGTDFGANTALRKRMWAVQVWKAQLDESFWFAKGFIAKNQNDMGACISRITDLSETDRGLECVLPLLQHLTGDGTVGVNYLEKNEEVMHADSTTIRYDKLRHGVRSKGEMAEQSTVIRFTDQAKTELGLWLADRLDQLMFLTISGRAYTLNTDGTTRVNSQLPQLSFAADVVAASSNRIVYPGTVTSEGTITANDKMSWQVLVNARTRAQRKNIREIRDGGKGYFPVVMSREQRNNLVTDPTYINIVKSSTDRGLKNPLLAGADVTVDGIAIFSHNKVFNTLGLSSGNRWGSGGTVHGAQALLLGAQAGGIALPGSIQSRNSDNTDYGDKPGLSIGRKFGMLKPQFPSPVDGGSTEDFGVVSIKTAAPQI